MLLDSGGSGQYPGAMTSAGKRSGPTQPIAPSSEHPSTVAVTVLVALPSRSPLSQVQDGGVLGGFPHTPCPTCQAAPLSTPLPPPTCPPPPSLPTPWPVAGVCAVL